MSTPNKSLIWSLITAIILLFLCSCRSVDKLKTKDKTETTTQTQTETATTRTITESFNQPITIESDSVSQLFDIFDNLPETFTTENESLIVTAEVKNGKIKLSGKTKPKKLNLPGERKIVESEVKKEDKKEESKSESKSNKINKEPSFNFNWLWLILLVVLYVIARRCFKWLL